MESALWKDRRQSYLTQPEPSALEIAAEQMRTWLQLDHCKFQVFLKQSGKIKTKVLALFYCSVLNYLL